MKTRHIKTTYTILTATLLLGLYNNFEFAQWSFASLDNVNEAARVSHAKELLGKGYKNSPAQKLEGKAALNYTIFNKIQSRLAPQWKKEAQSITDTIITESKKYNLDPVFVVAMIQTESAFNPIVRGRHGEIGLMQVKPDTAAWMSKKYKLAWHGEKTLENPAANIRLGLAYMHFLRQTFPGHAQQYVSAYNMGPLNVRRLVAQNIQPQEYSSRVMKNYQHFYKVMATTKEAPIFAAN